MAHEQEGKGNFVAETIRDANVLYLGPVSNETMNLNALVDVLADVDVWFHKIGSCMMGNAECDCYATCVQNCIPQLACSRVMGKHQTNSDAQHDKHLVPAYKSSFSC